MTRQELIDAAKARAQKLIDAGDYRGAVGSLLEDLDKHAETRDLLRTALSAENLVRVTVWPTEINVRRFVGLIDR